MADEKPQINSQPETPGSLDIYRSSREYKVKQGFRNMTPKKKLMLLALPILVVAIGVILYFTLAAGEPYLKLVWTDSQTTIEGAALYCSDATKKIDIIIDQNTKPENIVSVAAFIKYDPAKIEVLEIDVTNTDFPTGEGNTKAGSPGSMQKIDNTNGVVEITRGRQLDNGTPPKAFVANRGILATLVFSVKDNVELQNDKIFWFDTSPTKSLFVVAGGATVNPQYEASGEYKGTIKCCPVPNEKCLTYQYCPNNNWYKTLADAADRCCREKCMEGVEFYLFEREKTVEIGEDFEININMRPDYKTLKLIDIKLDIKTNGDLLENIQASNILFSGGVSGQVVSVNNTSIVLKIANYVSTNNVATTLATLKLKAKDSGGKVAAGNNKVEIAFDTTATKATLPNDDELQSPNKIGGTYTVVFKRIKLCPNTNLITEVNFSRVKFDFCTVPDVMCTATLTAASPPSPAPFSETTKVANHTIEFGSLRDGINYDYEIRCSEKPEYEDLVMKGNFVTLAQQNLTIKELGVDKIKASRATINWNTIGGANGNGLADSFVCYTEKGTTSYTRKSLADLVNSHSIELQGLKADTEYDFFVSSNIVSRNGPAYDSVCSNPPTTLCTAGGKECAKDGALTFKTKTLEASADANVILKVNKDRICDEWLYCDAAVQIKNAKINPPKFEDVCFKVGKCNRMDEKGNCISIVDEGKRPITVKSPSNIGDIRNLSGYSKVGVDWGYRCLNTGRKCDPNVADVCGPATMPNAKCVSNKIDGFYPYSQMEEVGIPVVINNSNFENGTPRPWYAWNNAEIENYNYDKANKVLRIVPQREYQGAIAQKVAAKVLDTSKFYVGEGFRYVISFWAKSEDFKDRDILAEIAYNITDLDTPNPKANFVRLKYYDPETGETSDYIRLGNVWKEYVVSISAAEMAAAKLPVNNPLNIVFVQSPENKALQSDQLSCVNAGHKWTGTECRVEVSQKPFYIDNISMKAVLQAGENMNYIPRTCRLYPTQSAPACDYYDSQAAKSYRGWKGYCVETDPAYQNRKYANQPMCLMWWPVDIINGESAMFYKDPNAVSYTGRKPLYYCLEGAGNYWRTANKTITEPYKIRTKHANYYTNGCDDYDPKPPSSGDYTFYRCQRNWSWQTKGKIDLIQGEHAEYGLKEWEIAYIEIRRLEQYSYNNNAVDSVFVDSSKFGTTWEEEGTGQVYAFWRTEDQKTGKIQWDVGPASDFHADQSFVRFVFDKQKGLETLYVDGRDQSGSKNEGSTYHIYYYLKEPCLKIAQVVDIDGNTTPRMERINSSSIAGAPAIWPGYKSKQDYSPYGSSLVPEPVWKPEEWGVEKQKPLYVEPPETTGGLAAPYQVRAGTPYAIQKPANNRGFGPAVCISGEKAGASCPNGREDCGFIEAGTQGDTYGECVGFNNTGDKTWGEINNIAQSQSGETVLKELFVRSYGVWEWKYVNGSWKYVKISDGWDATGLGVNPKVTFVWVGDDENDKNDINIIKRGAKTLKFGAWVAEDQKPLVRYTVDWGDGNQSTEANLTMSGRDKSDPFVLVHYYKYRDPLDPAVAGDPCDAEKCVYEPKVQIEDNWGKCNDGPSCSSDSAWKKFGGKVYVWKDQAGAPVNDAIPFASDDVIYFYQIFGTKPIWNSGLPQTHIIKLNNLTNGSGYMEWAIEPFSQIPDQDFLYRLLQPFTYGTQSATMNYAQTGNYADYPKIEPGGERQISLTINNTGSLGAPVGLGSEITHESVIKIKTRTEGQNDEKTINVRVVLEIRNASVAGPTSPTN